MEPADTERRWQLCRHHIFNPSANDYSASTAKDLARAGCVFEPANKARVLGATQMLKMLLAAKAPDDRPREEPALFITENCTNLLRTLPNMQRADDDLDDVSTEGDDHCYDALGILPDARADSCGAYRSHRPNLFGATTNTALDDLKIEQTNTKANDFLLEVC